MYDFFEPNEIKVALIAGGKSGEREISLASRNGASAALLEAGYQVRDIDPANKEDLQTLLEEDFDVAFLCLHGKGGEDGTIQGFLELIGLPYTGSNVLSSAISIDKSVTKMFYTDNDIPTPPALTLKRGEAFDPADIIAALGEKCVVKAATEGSSLGVYIAEGEDALVQAIHDALKIDTSVVIEKYIEGIEATVVVLGDGEDATALPIIEIIPQADSYDFDSKYKPGGSEHICPARLTDTVTAEVQAIAKQAHLALRCSGVSRTDFILDAEGNYWVLETNTIPGMTATSLLPDAAKAAGIEFPELCTTLIKGALNKGTIFE